MGNPSLRLVQLLYSLLPLIWFVGTGAWWAMLLTLVMWHRGLRPITNRWPR